MLNEHFNKVLNKPEPENIMEIDLLFEEPEDIIVDRLSQAK